MLFCVNLSLIVCFVGWFVTQQWCIHRLFGGKAVAFRRRAGGIPPKGQWRFGRIVVRYGRYRGHLLCFLRLDFSVLYVYIYKSVIYKIVQECVIFGQRDGWLKMTPFWESGCKVFFITKSKKTLCARQNSYWQYEGFSQSFQLYKVAIPPNICFPVYLCYSPTHFVGY